MFLPCVVIGVVIYLFELIQLFASKHAFTDIKCKVYLSPQSVVSNAEIGFKKAMSANWIRIGNTGKNVMVFRKV